MMDPAGAERLKILQEELLALKQHLGALQLKKTQEGPAAPFPITATGTVQLPPAAARYDVESLKLRLVLKSAAAAPPTTAEQLASAAEVQVLIPSLPASLREAMAMAVMQSWLALLPTGRVESLQLADLWEIPSRNFVHLISLEPHLLEPYEGVDEQGRTVRRFAILNEQAEVQIDASVPGAGIGSGGGGRGDDGSGAGVGGRGGSSGAAVPATTGAAISSSPGQAGAGAQKWARVERKGGGGLPAEVLASLPAGLSQEVSALHSRHGIAVRVLPAGHEAAVLKQPGTPQQLGDAPAAAAADLRQLSLTAQPQAHPAGTLPATAATAAPGAAAGFAEGGNAAFLELELSLQPTDPAWDPHSTLVLHCTVNRTTYPAAGSLTVTVHPSPPLPPLHLEVLQKLAAAEVDQTAAAPGRAGALRGAVRYLENHAGQLLRDAEDLAVEIAQRRAGQGAVKASCQGLQAGEAAGDKAISEPVLGPAQQVQQELNADPVSTQRSDGEGEEGGFGFSGSVASSSEGSYWSSEYEGLDSYDEEEEEGSEKGGSESDEEGERHGGLGHSEATPGGGLRLMLEGLCLVDCDSLEILRLNLQVLCLRCRHSGDATFATAAVALPSDAPNGSGGVLEWAGECGNCHNPWSLRLAPKIVHERSNVLAAVRAEGCAPQDLLPSMLAGQCGRCGAAAAFRSTHIGSPNERACGKCHSKISFQFGSALFVAPTPVAYDTGRGRQQGTSAGGAKRGMAPQGPATAFDVVLVPGQPLPNLGTCSFYRHSHRWLRFPCCGRRFCCDLHHEELTDGHDMRWATRMVCGYCSREQTLGERCKYCEKKLANTGAAPSGRNTRFWEGGEGCRDPRRMNRKDPRKFRGSKRKTQSRKHLRVGEKGAERREGRAAAQQR